jgi:hypothetical protein
VTTVLGWLSVVAVVFLPANALAGQGWYLLTPPWSKWPTETETGRVDSSAPLSQWGQDGAFETAQECERERNAAKVKSVATLQGYPDKDRDNILYKLQVMSTASTISGRCIATDDPRLKQ